MQTFPAREVDTIRVVDNEQRSGQEASRWLEHVESPRYEVAQKIVGRQRLEHAPAEKGEMDTMKEDRSSDAVSSDRGEKDARPIGLAATERNSTGANTTNISTFEAVKGTVVVDSFPAENTSTGESKDDIHFASSFLDDTLMSILEDFTLSDVTANAEDPESSTAILDEARLTTSSDPPTTRPVTTEVSGNGTSFVTFDDASNVVITASPAPTPGASVATSSSLSQSDEPTVSTDDTLTSPYAPTASPTNTASTDKKPQMVSPQLDATEPSEIKLQPPGVDQQGSDQDDDPDNVEPSSPPPTTENDDPYERHNRDWGDLELNADNDYTTILLAPPRPEMPEVTRSPSEAYSSSPSYPTVEPTIEDTATWEPTTDPTASEADLVAVRPPTAINSLQPTTTFSPTLTFQPSMTMRPTLTMHPTSKPTRTFAPTVTPEPTSTMQPTVTPAPSTLLDCLTANGSYEFGRVSTSRDNVTAVAVVFRYEVEFEEEFVPDVVQNDIVPKLELALNEQLLPTLFDSCKLLDNAVNTPSRRRLQTIGSPIVGISAARDDRVLNDGECSAALCGQNLFVSYLSLVNN